MENKEQELIETKAKLFDLDEAYKYQRQQLITKAMELQNGQRNNSTE